MPDNSMTNEYSRIRLSARLRRLGALAVLQLILVSAPRFPALQAMEKKAEQPQSVEALQAELKETQRREGPAAGRAGA